MASILSEMTPLVFRYQGDALAELIAYFGAAALGGKTKRSGLFHTKNPRDTRLGSSRQGLRTPIFAHQINVNSCKDEWG